MLLYNDPGKWNTRSRAEALAEKREDTDRRLQNNRLPDQAEFTARERRLGRVLHSSEVLRRLRRLGLRLYLTDGLPGQAGLYIVRNGELEFLGGMPLGWLPEYSIAHVNARNLPVREERGWRTLLVRLLKKRVVTERQLLQAFGLPSNGETASWYRRHLKACRG